MMASPAGQRREFSRVPFRLEVHVQIGDRLFVYPESRDISVKGIYVLGTGCLPVGTACQVTLLLGGENSYLRLTLPGRVAREDGEGTALEFTEMGLDAYLHLRALVLYNAADSATIEREFESHLGLKPRPTSE